MALGIEQVGRFFEWIYNLGTGITTILLIVIGLVIFFGIQYLFLRLYAQVFIFFPQIKTKWDYLVSKLNELFE